MLHLIMRELTSAELDEWMQCVMPQDELCFLADGIRNTEKLSDRFKTVKLHAILEDCERLNMQIANDSNIKMIGYVDLAELTAMHSKIFTW